MTKQDTRKRSIYLKPEMLEELVSEAKRQDRSVSWLLQQAWSLSRTRIMKLPNPEQTLNSEEVNK